MGADADSPARLGARFSSERPPAGNSGAPRKAERRRAVLAEDREPLGGGRRLCGKPPCRCRETVELRSFTDPEHRRAARPHERQAPFGRHRRRSEGPCKRDAGPIDRLLFRASPDDPRVRRRPGAKEVAPSAPGVEQHELPFGKADGERQARRAVAGPDVDHGPFVRLEKWERAQRVVEKRRPRGRKVQRRQPRGRDHRPEPAIERAGGAAVSATARRRRGDTARLPRSRS
jgi:hypothetical protein